MTETSNHEMNNRPFLSKNAQEVLKTRYLLHDEKGKITETPQELFKRVARAISLSERNYDPVQTKKMEKKFFDIMYNLEFLPNSPTLMNAGTKNGQLSACFVIPVRDSLKEIFDAAKWTAIIHQSGGGTGYSFSKLRPRDDVVRSISGRASGPVTFMTIFDHTTNVIKQGGRRRGANMGILRVDHPDVLEFINCKKRLNFLTNFNTSVAVTDSFMKSLKENGTIDLVNPRSNKVVTKIRAKKIFDKIVENAWCNGDPGIIFIDEINKHNPTPKVGMIEATNPCGEQPLLPWESCNLGSINLSKIIEDKKIKWEKLRELVQLGVRFLDNVIDANKWPSHKIEKITKSNRKIGLGIMGFADALIKLEIPYNSKKALRTAEKIMSFIQNEGNDASQKLGKERGSFPNFNQSVWKIKKKYRHMRNATVTTIAPTGTISIIAGCSSGIEPLFAIAYTRNIMEGTQLTELNKSFENMSLKENFYSEELVSRILKSGTIQTFNEIPKKVRRLFVTSMDIETKWHVLMQASFQKYVDNAVSKTINLPPNSKVNDVKNAFLLAHKVKCKGITIYRYGSKPNQVLTISKYEKGANFDGVTAESEFSGGCERIVCPH
jgi:ribonucleoside-diphosphate reductase alpha chain